MAAPGALTAALGSFLGSGALVVAGGLAGLALGVPLTFMAAPLIAAGGLALYFESGQLRDYFFFAGGALLTGAL